MTNTLRFCYDGPTNNYVMIVMYCNVVQHNVIVFWVMKRLWVLARAYGCQASLVPRFFGAAPKEPKYEATVKCVHCIAYAVFVASVQLVRFVAMEVNIHVHVHVQYPLPLVGVVHLFLINSS